MPKDKNGLKLKTCSDCKKTSNEVDFHMRKSGSPCYYSKRCIDCQNKYRLDLNKKNIPEVICEECEISSKNTDFDYYLKKGVKVFYSRCIECKKDETISERICEKCDSSSNDVEFRSKNYNKDNEITTVYAKYCKECEKMNQYKNFIEKYNLDEVICKFCNKSSLNKYFSHYKLRDNVILYDYCHDCKDKNTDKPVKICNKCFKNSNEIEFSTRKSLKKNKHEIIHDNICKICATEERRKEYNTIDIKLKNYKKSALSRNHKWNITDEEAIELFKGDCDYCGKESVENEDLSGIDRVDNKIGYTIKNCVSCCSVCNFMKRDLSKDEFINKCIEIAKLYEN